MPCAGIFKSRLPAQLLPKGADTQWGLVGLGVIFFLRGSRVERLMGPQAFRT